MLALLVCDEQSLYESKPLTGDDVVLKQISLELARDVPPLLLVEVLVPKQPQREVHIHVLVRRDEIAMLHLTVHAHRKPAPETAERHKKRLWKRRRHPRPHELCRKRHHWDAMR